MDQERLDLLLQRYLDQVLKPEEQAELERMLLESSRARSTFWRTAQFDAVIREWGQAEWGRRDAGAASPARVRSKPLRSATVSQSSRWGALVALTAAILAVYLVARHFLPLLRSAPETASLAVMSRASNAVWVEGTAIPQRGRPLKAGWLRLASGAVQIDFSRGARVVLEGPAELRLITDNEAELRSGKLRAIVPIAAQGFAVRGPSFVATDRGTEFACNVPASGDPEVHVFQGAVDLKAGSATSAATLTENHAVKLSSTGPVEIPARPEAFLSEEELNKRERLNLRDRFAGWRLLSGDLSRRPSTLVHVDFERENDWARTLPDRTGRGTGASVVGCDWTQGRWPGKTALEFTRPDDRVRLSIPGELQSLTLMAWVRVDRIPRWQGGLLMSDAVRPGAVHWYLYRDGSLGFGVHSGKEGQSRGWRHTHSKPFLSAEQLGSWIFLASAYDAKSGTLTHYLNGEALSFDRPNFRTPLRLDLCEIGNRAAITVPEDDGERIRRFEGRMDEFAAFAEAMPAAELRRIYEAGRPGPAR